MTFALALFAALFASIHAIAPPPSTHFAIASTHESADFHRARGWVLDTSAAVPRNTLMRVSVYLTHDAAADAAHHDWAMRVADPEDELYGRYETPEVQSARLVPAQRRERVITWLRSELTSEQIDERGDVLVLMASVDQLESLFHCKLRHFRKHGDDASANRPRAHGGVHVPHALRDDVAIVAGLTELFGVEHEATLRRDTAAAVRESAHKRQASQLAQVTPQLLRAYYNVSDSLHASGRYDVKQAVSGFEEGFSAKALAVFGQKIAKSQYPFVIAETPGGAPSPDLDQGEGDLDVQYVLATGQNVPTWFWSVRNTYWILEWALDVLGTKSPPLVHSLSYGTSIQQQCEIAQSWCHVLGYNSSAYVARTNVELRKLGASGVTVLVSAGDNGAPGRANNGHCPIDPATYCTLGGCEHSTSACDSVEMSVSKAGSTIECVLPMGASGYGCRALAAMLDIAPQNYSQIFGVVESVLQRQLGIADAGWDVDRAGNPHLYVPAGHSCQSISFQGSLDNGVFGFRGYVFDAAETHVGQTFVDEFPGSSPYILSVGMTTILHADAPEEAGSILNGGIVTGGGGFSIQEPQPAYQASAVAQFFAAAPAGSLPDANMYDRSKRGFPDIALTGERYIAVGELKNGTLRAEIVSGTSASSPALAGLLSLINERRLALGLPSLGFLNPALYKLASTPGVFHRISGGTNRCTHVYCCKFGWSANGEIWNPATGLGSPDFGNLYDALTS